jgi:hypothetical protein
MRAATVLMFLIFAWLSAVASDAHADPTRIGLLVIDREAAATGPALAKAARAQIEKVAQDAVIDLRMAKRTVACNLETFRELGVDTALCGVVMPKTISKLYVIESQINLGAVALTLAIFDRSDRILLEKHPSRQLAVKSSETYATLFDSIR